MPPEHLKPIVVSNGDHEVNAHHHLAATCLRPVSTEPRHFQRAMRNSFAPVWSIDPDFRGRVRAHQILRPRKGAKQIVPLPKDVNYQRSDLIPKRPSIPKAKPTDSSRTWGHACSVYSFVD